MRRPQFIERLQTITRSLFRAISLVIVVTLLSPLGGASNQALVADDEVNKLRNDQEAVAGRYSRFERLLSQMADMLGREDPERAELLRRAISEGREKAISFELEAINDSLNNGNFGSAREKQRRVTKSMQQILILLQSEDRRSEVEKERERLNELLKDIRNLTARQKAARAATQNSRSPSNAAPDQQQTLKKTDEILDDVESHDQSSEDSDTEDGDSGSEKGESEDKQSGNQQSDSEGGKEQKPGQPKDGSESKPQGQQPDGQQTDGEDSPDGKESKAPSQSDDDKKPQKGDPKEGDPKQSEQSGSKDGQETESSNSDSSDSSPSQQQESGQQKSGQQESGQQKQQQQKPQTPGREQLEEARKAMQEAIDQLKKQQRDGALKQQDDAISKLQEAQKKLEETLKQLREEEKEMILAALEARFQRMLSLQTQIYEDTVALGSTARTEWLNTAITRCRELSQQQSDLTRECSLTVGLLREDGTSVSILIAVEDIESDMQTVAGRLQQTKAAELTQSIQTDVIEALKELIETAQKEMEEMKQDQQQKQQQQSGPQQKAALVELMAEIKVLRSLQLRVNRRTATVDRLLQENDASEQTGLLNQLQELAIRQNRLTESAGELARQLERK